MLMHATSRHKDTLYEILHCTAVCVDCVMVDANDFDSLIDVVTISNNYDNRFPVPGKIQRSYDKVPGPLAKAL